MKENKTISIGLRVTQFQVDLLDKIISEGKATTRSAAIHYLINQYGITSK